MGDTHLPEFGTYCLGCYYDLRGLPAGRCPECGRSFDPASSQTFSRQSRATPVRDLLDRVGDALERLVTPGEAADPQATLRRLRSLRSASWFSEVERLRRENQVLRAQFDRVVEVLVERGLLDAGTIQLIHDAAEAAAEQPAEFVDPDSVSPADPAEDPTPELLELERAAGERQSALIERLGHIESK